MASLRFKDRKGFTIIEVLVVVGILGILTSIAVMQYQDVLATARGTRILADMVALDYAINIARITKGTDIPNGEITAVLPTELIPEFLSVGPFPSAGIAIINGGSAFTVPEGTQYGITSHRATINSKNREQVLADKSI